MTVTTSAPERPRRRRGFLFPLILIALGGLLLAANLGYLPPISARAVFSLWPVLLILGGIEILLARRDPFIALAVEILVIVAAVGLVLAQPRGLFYPAVGSSSEATIAREGTRSLSLRVDGGVGTYTISAGATALVEARSEGGEIRVRTTRRGDTMEVRVDPAAFGSDIISLGGPPTTVDLRVASDVPTTLRVSGGAGDFVIDLRDILVREAQIETGASKVDLTLPRPSGDVRVQVKAGAASVTIVVPDDVEARITTTGGLVSTTTLNPRLGGGTSAGVARSGSSMETAGYAAAKDKVTVTVEAGASSVTVR